MKKYFSYFKMCFKATSVYRVDFVLHMLINLVFFYIFYSLWTKIYQTSGVVDIHSYTIVSTITYYFVTSFIFRLDVSEAIFLNNDIWNGQFTNDLIKPWSVVLIQFIGTLSELLFSVVIYLPFWFFVFLTARSYIEFPTGANVFYFIITIFLGLLMNFCFNLIFHSLSFYFGDQEPNIRIVNYLAACLGGGIFPLIFLPLSLYQFFSVLPFRFLFYLPTEIYLGKVEASEIFRSWLEIIIWTAIFYLIFHYIFKGGLKRYSAIGR